MFFNSLVILMDGWNKHVTGVFHFLSLNKLAKPIFAVSYTHLTLPTNDQV